MGIDLPPGVGCHNAKDARGPGGGSSLACTSRLRVSHASSSPADAPQDSTESTRDSGRVTAIGQSTTSQRYNGITAIDGFTIGNSIVTATGTSYGIYANSYNNCDIRGKDTVIKATSTGGELAVYSQYPTAYYPYYGCINLYDDLCVTVSLYS